MGCVVESGIPVRNAGGRTAARQSVRRCRAIDWCCASWIGHPGHRSTPVPMPTSAPPAPAGWISSAHVSTRHSPGSGHELRVPAPIGQRRVGGMPTIPDPCRTMLRCRREQSLRQRGPAAPYACVAQLGQPPVGFRLAGGNHGEACRPRPIQAPGARHADDRARYAGSPPLPSSLRPASLRVCAASSFAAIRRTGACSASDARFRSGCRPRGRH
jgi:hypothetical protein